MSCKGDQFPELVLMTGHAAPIVAVVVSPDGATLATASYDNSVILWNFRSGTMRFPPLPHPCPRMLRFSPDGKTLAALGWDHLTLWNVATGKVRRECSGVNGNLLDYTPEGLLLAQWSERHETERIVQFDPCTEQTELLWDTGLGKKYHLACSPDGRQVAAYARHEIRLYDGIGGKLLRTRRVPDTIRRNRRVPDLGFFYKATAARTDVHGVVFLSQHLLAVHGDFALWLMDTRTGRRTRLLVLGDEPLSLAVSPDGTRLVSGHSGGQIVHWRLPSGRPLYARQGHHSWVRGLAFTPDGARLVSAGNDKGIKVWDAATGECVRQLPTVPGDVTALAYSPDGELLASAHQDAGVRLWDTRTGKRTWCINGDYRYVTAAAFSPDGRWLCIAAHDPAYPEQPSVVDLWDTASREWVRELPIRGYRSGQLAVSPDSRFLVHSVNHQKTQVWDLPTGELRYELKGGAIAISPDSRLLATGTSWGDGLRLWDLATGALVREMERLARPDWVDALRFSPDGKGLYAGLGGFAVGWWDVDTGTLGWTERAQRDEIAALALSPNGKTLALGGAYATPFWIWDLPERTERFALDVHRASMRALAFSPDGKQLASGSEDGTVKLWYPAEGKLLVTLMVLPPRNEEEYSRSWISFTPEGYYCGSSDAERFIRWRKDGKVRAAAAYAEHFNAPDRVRETLQTR